MTQYPRDYAQSREWGIPSVSLDRYPALKRNWTISKRRLGVIREALSSSRLEPAISTIAAAGSLARMEASEESDGDLIVVLRSDVRLDSAEASAAFDSVWQALMKTGLARPNPGGVFAQPVNLDALTGKGLGSSEEKLGVFGKRLLLLLESQPVHGEEEYESTLASIVARYAKGYVLEDPSKEWTFLLNDLIRYFRALCINYQWSFEKEHARWKIRNVKLRHSRLVMYAGLLCLLGEASKERADKVGWLKERLRMTPLERIAHVYAENGDWGYFRIAGLYNVFLSQLSDPNVRRMFSASIEVTNYADRYDDGQYADLKANSDALVAELLRFVLGRRGPWSDRFFEYLIF